jgi:hypothetical protein
MIYQILNTQGDVTNTIVADPEFMQANYPDGNYRQVPEPPAPPEPRYIAVGAFYDRFGDQKWPILSSTDDAVQGMIKDTQVRKYIDLDNSQLPSGLDMLIAKGFPINKNAIINDPVQPNEKP